MAGIDLKRELKDDYSAGRAPKIIESTPGEYLMVDGSGDPNDNPLYVAAIEALYAISYGIRAALKSASGDAYTVMPLEGQWWVTDLTRFRYDDRSDWRWTAMIRQPAAAALIDTADTMAAVTAKKRLARGGDVRLTPLAEGTVAQVMHRGPYSAERPTIEALHSFIAERGYSITGKHHEIYLSDPRKEIAGGGRTIIRYPIAPGPPQQTVDTLGSPHSDGPTPRPEGAL